MNTFFLYYAIFSSSSYNLFIFFLPSSCLISILSLSYSYLTFILFLSYSSLIPIFSLFHSYFISILSLSYSYRTEDHNDIIPFLRACYRKKILPAKNVLPGLGISIEDSQLGPIILCKLLVQFLISSYGLIQINSKRYRNEPSNSSAK